MAGVGRAVEGQSQSLGEEIPVLAAPPTGDEQVMRGLGLVHLGCMCSCIHSRAPTWQLLTEFVPGGAVGPWRGRNSESAGCRCGFCLFPAGGPQVSHSNPSAPVFEA